MAFALHNKENVEAPSSLYPYGRTKDKVAGLQAGTPLNTETHGDFHQFFSRLMAEVGLEENGQPDNNYTGFQLYEALLKTISKRIGVYSNSDDLYPTQPTDLNSFIHAGIYCVDAYTLSNDPGLDGPGQLIVGGNYQTLGIQRLVDLSNGAEWKRTIQAGSFGGWVLIRYAQKKVGFTWDMPIAASSGEKSINHLIPDFHSIATVQIFIKPNITGAATDGRYYDLCQGSAGISSYTEPQGGFHIETSSIKAKILSSGFFDNSSLFGGSVVNRGYALISYDPSN